MKSWIPQIGLTWSCGVDKFTVLMIILSLIVTICVFASSIHSKIKQKVYYFLLIILFINSILVFIARDLLFFYIMFEFLIVPFFILIGKFSEAPKTAMKFLIYSFFGGAVMLIGIIILYGAGLGEQGFYFENIKKVFLTMPENKQSIVFITLFIGLAIKAPMFPLHSWLKTTVQNSKIEISALLVSVFDKMGTFGMLYILVHLMPSMAVKYENIICVLAIISIIYGAFVALNQKTIITLISFSSISHFGFIILGIFSLNDLSIKGAKIYMLAHGVTICALFILSSFINKREGSLLFDKLGGLQRKYPYLSTMFLISCFSLMAVPGTVSFPAEFMIIIGAFQIHKLWVVFALFGAVLGVVYTLWVYQKIFTGKLFNGKTIKVPIKQKYAIVEKYVPLLLVLLMIVFGFFPMLLV